MKKNILSACISSLFLVSGVYAAETTWSGKKVIDEPVKLTRSVLKIEPGAKIVFQGKGALILSGGKLIAENADFSAEESVAGSFRISLNKTSVQLKQCRFNGLTTVKPAPKAKFIDGAIYLSGCPGSITDCKFTGCSAIALVNNHGFSIEKNQFIRPHTGIFLLNSRENRIANNSFDQASVYGIFLNGSALNVISDNRFTGCAIGIQLIWKGTGDNRFTGNSFFGGKVGIRLFQCGKANFFQGNLFEKTNYAVSSFSKPFGKDNMFTNNVFYRCPHAVEFPVQPDTAPVIFRNNAVCHAVTGIRGGSKAVAAENNLFWKVKKSTASVELKNTIDADPKFKDPENGDYRPAEGSPLLKAGTSGTNIGLFQ